MFQIKICGITTTEDGEQAARAGADAIGLNFYPGSPRFVSASQAREIGEVVGEDVVKVGVFVNADVDTIQDLAEQIGLDIIQLHGDEPPRTLRSLSDHRVVKAFRCRDAGFQPVLDFVTACHELGQLPDAVLLDAHAPGKYGGTGLCIDWPAVRAARPAIKNIPIVLAGGLTAENVDRAIAEARPTAVDAAGGVESRPGRKDPDKIRRFVANAQAAFRRVNAQPY